MPILAKLAGKPGGARNVIKWDMRVRREIPVTGSPYVPRYWIEIEVDFEDDAAMAEFEARVREMLPEVAH